MSLERGLRLLKGDRILFLGSIAVAR